MLTLRQRDDAWDLIREIQSHGIRLKADTTAGKVLFRPKAAMPFDLHGRLQEHKRAIWIILAALETPILPDTSPGTNEVCQFCGACRWVNPIAWQCGACWALWRPAAKVVAKVARGEGVKAG